MKHLLKFNEDQVMILKLDGRTWLTDEEKEDSEKIKGFPLRREDPSISIQYHIFPILQNSIHY